MLFEPSTFVTGTLATVTDLTNYFSLPLLSVGLAVTIIVSVVSLAYYAFVRRGIRGAARAAVVQKRRYL